MKARRWLSAVHRYLGLSVGLLFMLLGLSGSIITYQEELDAWLDPALLTTANCGERVRLDVAEAAVRSAMPTGAHLQRARLAHRPGGVTSWFYLDRQGLPWEMTQDPCTARVLGVRQADAHLLAWIYRLHGSLLMGDAGYVLLGVTACGLLVLLGCGIWLWWPRHGRWRSALTVKWSSSPARWQFDLHRAAGAYSSLLLLVPVFTGVYMALPPVMTSVVSLWSTVTSYDPPASDVAGPVAVNLRQAVDRALETLPDANPKVLVMPADGGGVYEINLFKTGDRQWRKHGEWTVFIGATTGRVLRVDAPSGHTAGDRFIRWQFPLHSGEAFGDIHRLVVALAGLVPSLLGVTGVLMWLRKRRKSHRHC